MIKDNTIPWVRLILALYVLKILNEAPSYGNQIADEIKLRTEHLMTPNTNALYPLLRVMEDKGYIRGAWENPDKRSKRIYEITALGVSYIPTLESKARERLHEIETFMQTLRRNLFGNDGETKKCKQSMPN